MQVADRISVEADLVGLFRQHFDGCLVVEDDLGLLLLFTFGVYVSLTGLYLSLILPYMFSCRASHRVMITDSVLADQASLARFPNS